MTRDANSGLTEHADTITDRFCHGLINYIDTKVKCRHLNKLISKGTLRQMFIRVYRLEIQSVMLVFSMQLLTGAE